MQWRKSSRSNSDGNCVEVATPSGWAVNVRDSKDRIGPMLIFTPAGWATFIQGAKDGMFDKQ